MRLKWQIFQGINYFLTNVTIMDSTKTNSFFGLPIIYFMVCLFISSRVNAGDGTLHHRVLTFCTKQTKDCKYKKSEKKIII